MDSDFPWAILQRELVQLYAPWSKPHQHDDQRQTAADFFFVRSSRRCHALSLLFESGLYPEATSIVRCAFEDWVCFAHALAKWDTGAWETLKTSVSRTDAQVYEGFKSQYGEDAAARCFPHLPDTVTRWLGTKPVRMDLAGKARAVGLDAVYRTAYPYLSAYAHPHMRPLGEVFDVTPEVNKAIVPRREAVAEGRIAAWAYWFELRILTLASSAYGIDIESKTDEVLSIIDGSPRGFSHAVYIREILESAPHRG